MMERKIHVTEKTGGRLSFRVKSVFYFTKPSSGSVGYEKLSSRNSSGGWKTQGS
jgi:hypothetical protein